MRQFFVFIFLLFSFSAVAQFKVKLGGGYAIPAYQSANANETKAGFLYAIEPQYGLLNNLDVGLRFEQAFIQRAEYLDNVLYYQSKAKSVLSAVLTANYTIPIGSVRPYIGVGTGLYYADASEQINATVHYPLPVTTNIGGMGRVGVRYGIVHVEADYNLVGDTNVTNNATRLTLTAKNSYFSLKAGITIGGGGK